MARPRRGADAVQQGGTVVVLVAAEFAGTVAENVRGSRVGQDNPPLYVRSDKPFVRGAKDHLGLAL